MGTSASCPPVVCLALAGESSLRASSNITLKPLELDAIEAGNTAVIQTQVALQRSLPARSYKLISTVDPDCWAGDVQPENNSRTVKKTIVVN